MKSFTVVLLILLGRFVVFPLVMNVIKSLIPEKGKVVQYTPINAMHARWVIDIYKNGKFYRKFEYTGKVGEIGGVGSDVIITSTFFGRQSVQKA
jgi:hypothetical protein